MLMNELMEMTRTDEAAWLFTRDQQSVRMLRVAEDTGLMRLLVHGPGRATAVYNSDDLVESMRHQADLERTLLAQGFQLDQSTANRRSGRERRLTPRGPDRRRDQ